MPEEPKFNAPSFTLASATKSATLLTGDAVLTTSMCGVAVTETAGIKSFCPLKGNAGLAATLMARPFWANRMV